MATIKLSSRTQTSITVYVDGLDSTTHPASGIQWQINDTTKTIGSINCTFDNLNAGTTYKIAFIAYSSVTGVNPVSASVKITTSLGTPTIVSITTDSSKGYSVSYGGVNGAQGYTVVVRDTNNNQLYEATGVSSSHVIPIESLDYDITCNVYIVAYRQDTWESGGYMYSWSAARSLTTISEPVTPDPEPDYLYAYIEDVSITDNSISVQMQNLSVPNKYQIHWSIAKQNENSYAHKGETTPTTKFTFTDLTSKTTYKIRAILYNDNGSELKKYYLEYVTTNTPSFDFRQTWIKIPTIGTNIITAELRDLPSTIPSNYYVKWYITKKGQVYDSTGEKLATNVAKSFEHLTPGTLYNIKVELYSDQNDFINYWELFEVETLSEQKWSLGHFQTYKDIKTQQQTNLTSGLANYVLRYTISFAFSGVARFQGSSDSTNIVGYLSQSTDFDSVLGEPKYPLEVTNYGSEGEINFQYNVTAGVTYYLWIRPTDFNVELKYQATITPPINEKPTAPEGLTTKKRVNKGFVVNWYETTGANDYDIEATYWTDKINTYEDITDTSYTITDLPSGSDITLHIRAKNDYGVSDWSSSIFVHTSPSQPILSASASNNQITVTWTTENSNYDNIIISLWQTSTTNSDSYINGAELSKGISTHTFPNLSAGTYKITAYTQQAYGSNTLVCLDDYGNNYVASTNVITIGDVLSQWVWTEAELNAFNNHGDIKTLTYERWNELVEHVNQILGGSWDTTYATFDGTKMSSDDKTLTATKFNSLIFNINNNSTGISAQRPGNIVYGWYFITIAECINSWIDSL